MSRIAPTAVVAAVVALMGGAAAPACRSSGKTTPTPLPPPHGLALTGYHGGPARLGWNDDEPTLTPARARTLAPAWSSPALDVAIVDGERFAPHLYASPLYLDDIAVASAGFEGLHTSLVVVATSNGDVYAINAIAATSAAGPVEPGRILWHAHLGEPSQPLRSSDGVPLGILSTPVVDLRGGAPRLYVTCADASAGWRAFALELGSGAVVDGWPVALSSTSIQAANRNGGDAGRATFADFHAMSQRAALNVSGDGHHLYAAFGSYFDGAIGWMVSIDTEGARIEASFSGSPVDVSAPPTTAGEANLASAGMWGAGGPAVAPDGHVFETTGNSPPEAAAQPGVWGNSLLRWSPPLTLDATYSPFNYCSLDGGDTDLGGGSPLVFDLDPATTSTPHLVAFGGKQGNLYLADRDALGGGLDRRGPCDPSHSGSPAGDRSLFGPEVRGYYAPPSVGPLNVFGPYSDVPGANELNNAKARTSPAFYREATGAAFLYVAGNSRSPDDITKAVPPSLARVRVVTTPGAPAYLALESVAKDVVFVNPGAPVVSSMQSRGAVVWVTDENGRRTDPLVPKAGVMPPRPVLYAFDALTLEVLFQRTLSATGGKYNHPTVAHGVVYVGTDRLEAFAAP